MLQKDEIVGKGVTAHTTAGTPKGTLQDGKPAHERGPTMQEQEHTNKAPSSQPRHETPVRTEAAGTEQHTQHQTALSATKAK